MADSTQLVAAQMAYDNEKKTGTPAWVLWWFTGALGGHRYYLGDIGYAVCMTFFGWMTLGIWPLVDAFFINRRLRQKNADKQREIFARYGVLELLPPEQFVGQYAHGQFQQPQLNGFQGHQPQFTPQAQPFQQSSAQQPVPMTAQAPAQDATFAPQEAAQASEAAPTQESNSQPQP